MQIPLLDLKRQYEEIKSEVEPAVLAVLSSAQYILGNEVIHFEAEFAHYIDVKHAISVANGTDALVIALKALQVKPGDEVITSPYTFFATVEAIMAVGATPVFVDVNEYTYNLDVEQLEKAITKKTKGILPVHLFGQCISMDAVEKIAKQHGLFVLEDACQAAGASYLQKMAGSMGDISAFSFFPTKNLGCAGDGGMICTNNDELATFCRALRAHGGGTAGAAAVALLQKQTADTSSSCEAENPLYNEKKYHNHLSNAQNSRLDEIQAAILRIKLHRLNSYITQRRHAASYYTSALQHCFKTPVEEQNAFHSYHLYILQSECRTALCASLKEKGIATGIYYPVPMHLQPACSHLGYQKGDLPVAEYLSLRTFAIPLFPELQCEEQDYIIKALLEK